MNICPPSLPTAKPRLLCRAALLLFVFSRLLIETTRASAPADTAPTATAAGPDGMTSAPGSAWNTETNLEIVAFNHWAQRLVDSTASRSAAAVLGGNDLAAGVCLARTRRDALLRLMATDPAHVIAAGVPAAVRARLPADVLAELETPFSAVGDYTEYGVLRALGGPAVVPTRQEVRFDGHVYPVRVYGRRVGLTTKRNIFLHGVLIGNEALLDENVLRVLPADEAVLETRAPRDVSATAGPAAASPSGPVLVEAGTSVYRFVSDEQVRHAETTLRVLEAHRTPETSDAAEPAALENPAGIPTTPDSAYTTGTKQVLVIRVDFSDMPGDPMFYGTTDTPASIQNITDTQVKPYYVRSSYNLTALNYTISSQLYRLPRTASSYATAGDNTGLHTDAETAAGADYDVASYDRVLVLFTFLGNLSGSQITYGGLAQVGGRDLWINGEFDFRVVAHETGHTYGLIHGNLWQVTDGNPASLSGSSTEYGDDYDTMGANFANTQSTDFNAWYKTQLDWIPTGHVQRVTASGTYRVYRFDGGSNAGIVALEIVKDGTRNYWVSIRRNFTSNANMTHGVYLTWGYNSYNIQHNLLDTQTPGNSDSDAGLPTGTTFTDTAAAISITPVAEGGTSPNEYEDVQVTVDTSGAAPAVNSAKAAGGTVGTAFSYQITATNTPTSYAASNLPAGLSVDTSMGIISGTPTVDGTFAATVSALNGSGIGSAALTLTLAKSPNAPTITSFSPTFGPVGTTVVINGTNFAGLQYIIFGGNAYAGGSYSPTQITATVPNGAVSGPITVGTSNGMATSATSFTVGTAPPAVPVITSASTASGTTGTAFAYQITATNGPTSYGVQGLPGGLTVDAGTGLVSGTPKFAGTYSLTLNASNGAGKGSSTLTLTIVLDPPVVTSASAAAGTQGSAFSYQITASGNPTAFGVQGLPGGLTVNSSTGLLSGTPNMAGTFPLTLNAYNSVGKGSATLTLTVAKQGSPVIASAATASGEVGAAFSYQIEASHSPTSYGVQGLPGGLSVNATTGLIAGTPKFAGTYTLTLNAYNSTGKGSAALSLAVAP